MAWGTLWTGVFSSTSALAALARLLGGSPAPDTAPLAGVLTTEEETTPKLEENPVPINGVLDRDETVVVEVVEVEETE